MWGSTRLDIAVHQLPGGDTVQLSARNQLKGQITHVKSGSVMAEVEVKIKAGKVVAAITDGSVKRLINVTGSAVHNIGETPLNGTQHGNAIYYRAFGAAQ